jgi:hypothetical protein
MSGAVEQGSVQRGGVLLRLPETPNVAPERMLFVPADVATRLGPLSTVTEIAGVRDPALGIALTDGRVVTVLALAGERSRAEEPRGGAREGRAYRERPVPGSDRAVFCDLDGEIVALTGGEVVATGLFEPDEGDGVLWRGERVPRLDVRALYAQAEAAIWAARATAAPHGGMS